MVDKCLTFKIIKHYPQASIQVRGSVMAVHYGFNVRIAFILVTKGTARE